MESIGLGYRCMPISLPLEFDGGRLRRLRPGDLAAFQAYRALPELGRYQGWTPMSEADAIFFLARMQEKPLLAPGQWLQLGIGAGDDDALVGDIGLYLDDEAARAEIGYTLAPSAQGRGIATAAVRAALRLVFANTALREVVAHSDRRNLPSLRLLERAGFVHRGDRAAEFRGEDCVECIYVHTRDA